MSEAPFPSRLASDRRGAALMEFALALPIVLAMGGYGVELGNKAIVNMRISQIALSLADNTSRIGVNNGQAIFQLREGDLNDIFQGARLMGANLKLTTFGRVTVTSVENVQRIFSDGTSDAGNVQRIHWQRCMGGKGGYGTSNTPIYDSSYGQATPLATAGTDTSKANAGVTATTGFGQAPSVQAPANGGAIFVEINYEYQPLFGSLYASKQIIHYVASFVVRDRRDFSQIYNPKTALGTTPRPSTCDLHEL